jgi:formate dehydrogenase (coenzyme F420) beta subunit
MNVQELLRKRTKELLEQKQVTGVLGYRAGGLPDTVVPTLISRPEQADTLVYDERCLHNLAAYLPRLKHKGKLAVIASGPTSRSIVNLLKENQVKRENLHIIGIAGPIQNPKSKTQNPRGTPNAVLCDEFIGDRATEPGPDDYADVAAFEKLSSEERWQALSKELSRCIRCYACRQSCPNCYCPTCFVDANQPQWVGRTTDDSDTVMFHIMRAMHMAGRCVECGACARACPMGIDLMRLNRKVALIVRDRFGHVSGMKLEDPLPLASFQPDDRQEFIR